jgi:hypothetical protein
MGYRNFTREAYSGTAARVELAGGDTSFAGRQEIKKTGKLHALVDPAGYGMIRPSRSRYVELPDGTFHNVVGVPIPVETVFDTTGSMGHNVGLAFKALPDLYDLLTTGSKPVLGRYDVHIGNGIFGDIIDMFICARTQFEADARSAEQLTLMVPEYNGGDGAEDPEYSLFASAYLTKAFIREYGLSGYHFMVTDAPSHGRIDHKNLVRVFGDDVYNKVKENGHEIDRQDMPDTKQIVKALKAYWHAFAVIVKSEHALEYWQRYYGTEHVVFIKDTSDLPYVETAIIGLTEGVVELSEVGSFLVSLGCSRDRAKYLHDAVSCIPVGAQASRKGFAKIPPKGAVYAKKGDKWPIKKMPSPAPEAVVESKWL